MTLSVVARCAETGLLGVAALTATPGVGQLVAWAEAGVGAVATQSWTNPYLGIDALALLRNGHDADRALRAVVSLDDDATLRQVGMVDARGNAATHTGSGCEGYAGHQAGGGYSVQGNLLESAETIEAAAGALRGSSGEPLVERLLQALEAGAAAGGDKRGHRSGHVLVVATEYYPLWDVRVDDHDDPLTELRRLVDRFEGDLLPQIRKLPTRLDTRGQLVAGDLDGLF